MVSSAVWKFRFNVNGNKLTGGIQQNWEIFSPLQAIKLYLQKLNFLSQKTMEYCQDQKLQRGSAWKLAGHQNSEAPRPVKHPNLWLKRQTDKLIKFKESGSSGKATKVRMGKARRSSRAAVTSAWGFWTPLRLFSSQPTLTTPNWV